jgi:hypothetical protein
MESSEEVGRILGFILAAVFYLISSRQKVKERIGIQHVQSFVNRCIKT